LASPEKHIVTTGLDDNYLLPFLVMAHSAKKHSKNNFYLKIAFGKNLLSKDNRIIISKVLNILQIEYEFIQFEINLKLRKEKWIATTSYLRLNLADTEIENFLWLDCDLICLDGWDDLFEDYDLLWRKFAVCAAKDSISLSKISNQRQYKKNEAFMKMKNDYFNAGVLLVNTKLWKDIQKRLPWTTLYENYQNYGFQFADQCILNYTCDKSFAHLDKHYNVFASSRNKFHSKRGTKILHYAGGEKPWTYEKNDFSIFFSSIGRKRIRHYLEYQSELIELVERNDVNIGKYLERIQRNLKKSRTWWDLWWKLKWLIKQKLFN
jgi:lipopolysaccharide biosynthesis glycosyltransferase